MKVITLSFEVLDDSIDPDLFHDQITNAIYGTDTGNTLSLCDVVTDVWIGTASDQPVTDDDDDQ